MYRVVKSANKLSGRWIDPSIPNFGEEGTAKGKEVRDMYYSGRYSSGANDDGSSFDTDSDLVQVLADLMNTRMYVQSYDDSIWYLLNTGKGVLPNGLPSRVRVSKFKIENGEFEFLEENLTSLSSLIHKLEDPLIIRTLEEAVKESM